MVDYKPFAIIQSFFLLVDTILQIKCSPIFKEEHYSCQLKPFSRIFADNSTSMKQFFRLVETEFLSNAVHSYKWKWIFWFSVLLFTAHFMLVETIIQIKIFFLLKTIFYAFFLCIFLPMKTVSRCNDV